MEGFLSEYKGVKQAGVPASLLGAALTGARINLEKNERIAIIVSMGDSVGATTNFSFQQHDAASAGNSKALSVDNAYYHKVAGATVSTKVVPGAAASSFDLSALFVADEGIVVFEVLAEDLDVANGYDHISFDVADTIAAKIVSVVYMTNGSRFLPAYAEAL